MKTTLIQTVVIAAILAACGSCRRIDNVVYSEFAAFGNEGWDPVCAVNFSPWPSDSIMNPSDRYNVILTLRYSPQEATSEIPLEITEEDETGVIDVRRVTMRVRDDDGTLIGRKSVVLHEIADTLRRNFKIPDGYNISITSLSPADNTRCLRNIGMTLTAE